jgi:hypothetical protein
MGWGSLARRWIDVLIRVPETDDREADVRRLVFARCRARTASSSKLTPATPRWPG